jgi:hypothetical protein
MFFVGFQVTRRSYPEIKEKLIKNKLKLVEELSEDCFLKEG